MPRKNTNVIHPKNSDINGKELRVLTTGSPYYITEKGIVVKIRFDDNENIKRVKPMTLYIRPVSGKRYVRLSIQGHQVECDVDDLVQMKFGYEQMEFDI